MFYSGVENIALFLAARTEPVNIFVHGLGSLRLPISVYQFRVFFSFLFKKNAPPLF